MWLLELIDLYIGIKKSIKILILTLHLFYA